MLKERHCIWIDWQATRGLPDNVALQDALVLVGVLSPGIVYVHLSGFLLNGARQGLDLLLTALSLINIAPLDTDVKRSLRHPNVMHADRSVAGFVCWPALWPDSGR